MANMATFKRYLMTVAALPRKPRFTTLVEVDAALRKKGIRVTRRTLQRDLLNLSSVLPIVCDDKSKPHRWSMKHDVWL